MAFQNHASSFETPKKFVPFKLIWNPKTNVWKANILIKDYIPNEQIKKALSSLGFKVQGQRAPFIKKVRFNQTLIKPSVSMEQISKSRSPLIGSWMLDTQILNIESHPITLPQVHISPNLKYKNSLKFDVNAISHIPTYNLYSHSEMVST